MFIQQSQFTKQLAWRLITAAVVIAAGAWGAPPLRAQPAADPPAARQLLDGYVAEALAANLAIAQQTENAKRANAAVREANGRFLPSLDLNARYSEFSGVVNIGDFINPAYTALNQLLGQNRFPTNVSATLPFTQETKFELTQPLFNDALFAARAAARAQRDLVTAGRYAAMRQLAADVQLAWLGYASTVRALQTLDATLPVLVENVRVSERLVDAGQATPDVLLRARAERSELEQQIAEVTRQRDAAHRGFNLLRNQPELTPIALAADSTLLAEDLLPRDDVVNRALQGREELAQAGSGLRIANAQQRLVASSFLPNLTLAASYGVQGDRYRFDRNNDVALASLVLSWNVLNGGQDAARREQALATRNEATLRRREAELAVRVQVQNAYDAVMAARRALLAATDREAAASRAFLLVERRFAEGLATPLEFLSARAANTGAALNVVVTRFTVASRVVELERAAALRTLPN